MKPKILFISHDASRTGAPIVFLHQLKWLKESGLLNITILLIKGGPLQKQFEALAPTYIWNQKPEPPSIFTRALNKLSGNTTKQTHSNESVLKALDAMSFDLIYSNTVASHEVANALKSRWSKPWISHIHEMPFSIDAFFSSAVSKAILQNIDHFIFVSKAAKKLFISKYLDSPIQASLVYECVPTSELPIAQLTKAEAQEKWSLKDKFIVGGSGVMSWRKGIDIFIEVARTVQDRGFHQIAFVWVGEIKNEVVAGYHYENERLKLEPNITFTGSLEKPVDAFQIFNVFTLTSREDPFPLVCLEAAALAKPILCFADSGGIPEWIEKGGGIVVPFVDVSSMADQIISLYQDRKMLDTLGLTAQQTVQDYNVANVAPLLPPIIHEVLTYNQLPQS
jgi:glycosyltransferase involved in cell wall biosynthesis